MKRGFSTIEIFLALAIMSSTVVAITLVTIGMPLALAQARLEYSAFQKMDSLLQKNMHLARTNFNAISSVATTTDGMYEISLESVLLSDEVTKRVTVRVHFTDARGNPNDSSLVGIVTDPNNLDESTCAGVVAGDWQTPVVQKSYVVEPGKLLPGVTPADQYPVADVAVGSGLVALAIDATIHPTSPELFLFKTDSMGELSTYGPSYDNAPASRFGFSSVVIHRSLVYAANSFGSASLATCKSAHNCDQLQIFDATDPVTSNYLSSLQLATLSAPFAVSAGGVSTGAKSIAYKNGFIYLGLLKTISGDEFNIIDVRDPLHPVWTGGARIGRTVNKIIVSGGKAYVATDDNARELVVFDIQDPTAPSLLGSWNAPGSIGFGYGTAIHVQNENIYFGRSYVSNAPELSFLLGSDLSAITEIGSRDIGTFIRPESVNALVVRDFLTFVLMDSKLQIWDTSDLTSASLYAEISPLSLNSTATSLACKNNRLYVGGYQNAGNIGELSILTSS